MIMVRVGIQVKPPLLEAYILPSGPSAAPFGPPGICATTSLRPSGQTRVSRWPRISTSTTEPSGITTGPSGNSRSVARTRILAMKNPPGSFGCGRIFGEPPRATFSLRLLWQRGSRLPTRRPAQQVLPGRAAARSLASKQRRMHFPGLFVQIADRFAFVTQRTNVRPRNDLTGQTVNFVALGRRPAAKILDTFEQAQSEDLGIFAQPHQIYRVLACRDRIAGHEFKIFPRAVGEFGGAANNAVDDDLAFSKKGSVRCCGGALRQQRLATRIGRNDMSRCKAAARNLDADVAHENGSGEFDR